MEQSRHNSRPGHFHPGDVDVAGEDVNGGVTFLRTYGSRCLVSLCQLEAEHAGNVYAFANWFLAPVRAMIVAVTVQRSLRWGDRGKEGKHIRF